MNIVITGTSRGIGLEMAQLALSAGNFVVAVARDPNSSKGLQKLKADFAKKLEIVTADVQDVNAGSQVATAVAKAGGVDILVNNAGIYRKNAQRADFLDSFLVNSVAPFEMTQALLPQLQKSKSPRVGHITSLMGSIGDNGSGGSYAYRASKAALNMINKSLAKDNPWLCSVVLHPGWVQTDMGGSGAPTPARESAEGLLKVILGLKASDSGRFFDFRGKELPW